MFIYMYVITPVRQLVVRGMILSVVRWLTNGPDR